MKSDNYERDRAKEDKAGKRCHLILLTPLIGLPIFWLVPLSSAIPVYLVIVLVSVFLYRLITRAMKKPVQDGFQSLVGTRAEVMSRAVTDNYAKYTVLSQGELWSAYSKDSFQPGENVKIVAVRGVGVVVER